MTEQPPPAVPVFTLSAWADGEVTHPEPDTEEKEWSR